MHNIRSIVTTLIVILVVWFLSHTEDVKVLGSDECKADNSQDGDPKAWEVNPDQIDWEYGPLGEEDRSWEEEEVEDETMEAIHYFFEVYGQPGSPEIRIQEDVAAFRAACLPLYELHAAVEQLDSLLDGGQYEEAYECFYLWARKEIAQRNYNEEEAYEQEDLYYSTMQAQEEEDEEAWWQDLLNEFEIDEADDSSRDGDPNYEAYLMASGEKCHVCGYEFPRHCTCPF